MLTTVDKTIVTVLVGLVQLGAAFHLYTISPETVTTITSILTPIVVWLVPNKTS